MLRRIPGLLLSWFAVNRREMEWRSDPLPYYVWVSEIMLQQTRVEAVRPYFHRFVTALPDISALAACPEDRLLKLWEGLGYYSRVRNLQKAARIVMERYDGRLPADADKLRELPGIGDYTAGAIASIAFGLPEPAVDGNVLRVLSRVTGSRLCIDEPKVKDSFRQMVRGMMGDGKDFPPGDLNQALMETGALVCLPNGKALCGGCPLEELCAARARGCIDEIPVRKEKKARRIEERTVLVVRDATRTLLHRRPEKGLLAGLWELPNAAGHLTPEETLAHSRSLGLSPVRITPLPEARHIFSHVEWRMTGYLVLTEEIGDCGPDMAVVESSATERDYPIPAAFAAYTEYLNIRIGQKKYEA